MKGFVRKVIKTGFLLVYVWANNGEVEVAEEPEPGQVEQNAAYLTTGLITAMRAVHKAHDKGENCGPYHEAAQALLESVEDQMTAVLVIQHLLQIAVQTVSDEDLQRMVATIVAHELVNDEDEDDDFDF